MSDRTNGSVIFLPACALCLRIAGCPSRIDIVIATLTFLFRPSLRPIHASIYASTNHPPRCSSIRIVAPLSHSSALLFLPPIPLRSSALSVCPFQVLLCDSKGLPTKEVTNYVTTSFLIELFVCRVVGDTCRLCGRVRY